MTYRLDSDIFIPFIKMRERMSNRIVSPSLHVKWKPFDENFFDARLYERALKKDKNIFGVISHCNTARRKNLVNKLKKLIDFDIYGECGKLK